MSPNRIIPFPELAATAEQEELHRVQHRKQTSYFYLLAMLPYYGIRALWVRGVLLFSPVHGRLLAARFLRHFFSRFFTMRGVLHYSTEILPSERLQKPILVIGNRYHFLSSLFAYSLFPSPLIIPLPHGMTSFTLPWFRPIQLIGPFFKFISYYDAPLKQNLPNISVLLKKGYSVFVHANHGINDLRSDTTLYLHRSVVELLKLDIDVYLMHFNGFENYKFSSFRNPIIVSTRMSLASDILAGVPLDDPIKCGRALADFFGCPAYKWV